MLSTHPEYTAKFTADADAINKIALAMGTDADWSAGDMLESIADIIGEVRPHPGGKDPVTYPLELVDAIEVPAVDVGYGPEGFDELDEGHGYTAVCLTPFTDGNYPHVSWWQIRKGEQVLGNIGDATEDNDEEPGYRVIGDRDHGIVEDLADALALLDNLN